jgi:hypothetical protein
MRRSSHQFKRYLTEVDFVHTLSTNPSTVRAVRERLTTLERGFIDSLMNSKRPRIRIRYSPSQQLDAEFIVPCHPRQRKQKESSYSVGIPSKKPRLSISSAVTPKFTQYLTDSEVPTHLPRLVDYKKDVIRKIRSFNTYRWSAAEL